MNPVIALIITNLIWGGASPIFKYALQNIPPFTLAFIRFFGAALLFLPIAIKHWQKVSLRDLLQIILGAFFGITVNISFFFLGLERTSSINAPVIASSQPIFLFIFSLLFLREKFRKRVFAGMIISLVGVMVIILTPFLVNKTALSIKESVVEGNLLLLLATLGAVGNVLVYKKILKRINIYYITFISFLSGSLFFLPFIPGELQKWSFAQLNIQGWTGIVYGVFFSSALAYFLFNYGISKIQGQEVGIFSYIDPVAAVLIAIPLLHEYPNVVFLIGSLLVFLGILIAESRVHYHPIHKIKLYKLIQANTKNLIP